MRESFKKFLKKAYPPKDAERYISIFGYLCLEMDGACCVEYADKDAVKFIKIIYTTFTEGYKAGKESK